MKNKTITFKIIDGIMMGKAFNTFLLLQCFYYFFRPNAAQFLLHVITLVFSIVIHTWNEDRKAKLLKI